MSSNYGPNSTYDATKVWVPVLHLDMKNSKSTGFLSTAIDLAWMIDFMILRLLNRSFIVG